MSSVIKGIVDESEEVAVIYIDGKPSVKYAKKHEADADASRMREKFPNKKIEIKHEVREDDDLEELDENLRKWFKEKWVRFGPDGKIRGACARGDDSEGKPKCLPQKKAHSLGKKGRKYAASKKRREDPNPDRRGPAKNVATKKKTNEDIPFNECPECRGEIVHESMMNEKQDACYHKVKARYKVWPSAYASGALVQCRKKGAKNWGNKSKKNESITESFLAEGKFLIETRITRKLWESAGQKLVEAQLTQQQIEQIFKAAEEGMTAGGANRTLAGKGKDAASAVNRAWEDLKTKIQNSGPIQNMDAMYDKAAEQLKAATGGDQGAMQYVQKYRDFAKKHPIAQSFLYAALIAAAGLSGAGAGGAAALGLLKMTDKLLQGQKFSSAAYAGAKTGGLAYAAGQLGQKLKGTDAQPASAPKPGADQLDAQGYPKNVGDMDPATAADHAQYQPAATPKPSMQPGVDARGYPTNIGDVDPATAAEHDAWYGQGGKGMPGAVTDAPAGAAKQVAKTAASKAVDQGIDPQPVKQVAKSAFQKVAGEVVNPDQPLSPMQMATVNAGKQMGKQYSQDVLDAYNLAVQQGVKPFVGSVVQHADGTTSVGKNAFNFESRQLTKRQIFAVINEAALQQRMLNEGIMDTAKNLAGKAGEWAKTKGHNITTKITADKLMQAWKKAGSPTDSEDIRSILFTAGVDSDVLSSVLPSQVNPDAAPSPGPAQATQAAKAATPGATATATGTQPARAAGAVPTVKEINSIIPTLKRKELEELRKMVEAFIAAKTKQAPAAAVQEGVIVGHDKDDPEVAILGGAGTMSLSRLKKKAKAEADMLANDLAKDAFKAAAYNIKQLENTLNTIKAAEAEMEKLYFGEDYTGEFAAEVTPAVNPYGGLKDRKFRSAIGEAIQLVEMPDTSGPVGVQPGGWRTYSPKPAGQVDESRMHQYDINDAIKKVEDYHRSHDRNSRGPSTRLLNVLYQWHNTEPNNIVTRAQLLRTPNMGKQAMALLDTLMGNVSKDESPYDQNKNQSLAIVDSLKQAIASDDMRSVLDLLRELKNSIGTMDRLSYKRVKEDTAYAGGMGQGGAAGQSYRKFKPKSAGTFNEDEIDEACWKGYHKEGNKKMFGKTYPNCVKNTNEGIKDTLKKSALGLGAAAALASSPTVAQSVSQPQQSQQQSPRTDLSQYSIKKLRFGMTPEEVGSITGKIEYDIDKVRADKQKLFMKHQDENLAAHRESNKRLEQLVGGDSEKFLQAMRDRNAAEIKWRDDECQKEIDRLEKIERMMQGYADKSDPGYENIEIPSKYTKQSKDFDYLLNGYSIAGFDLWQSLEEDGKLVSLYQYLNPDDIADTVRIFTNVYGKPSTRTQPVQTRMGYRATNLIYTWKVKDVTITLRKYAGRIDRGEISIDWNKADQMRASQRNADVANATKDFEESTQLDEKCWDSHKQVGMKKKGGKMVPNCVPKESAIMKGINSKRI